MPDAHGTAVLLLIGVALFLFTRDHLPLETSILAVLIALVVGKALETTGALQPLAMIISKIWLTRPLLALFVMLPMGLATIIGGMSTTIGTSTNLLVGGIAMDLGLPEIGMFDFVLPVAIVGGVGLMFVWLIAPRLLPDRERPMADTAPRVFSGQFFVKEESCATARFDARYGLLPLAIHRARGPGRKDLADLSAVRLRAGDVLLVPCPCR